MLIFRTKRCVALDCCWSHVECFNEFNALLLVKDVDRQRCRETFQIWSRLVRSFTTGAGSKPLVGSDCHCLCWDRRRLQVVTATSHGIWTCVKSVLFHPRLVSGDYADAFMARYPEFNEQNRPMTSQHIVCSRWSNIGFVCQVGCDCAMRQEASFCKAFFYGTTFGEK